MAKSDAEKQGMQANLTHVVSQDPENVFQFICKTLEGIHKQSVSLVCGIAQLMIVRTFHQDDNQRWKLEKTRDFLKAQLNERGLKRAAVYMYIATGQELARLIQKKYGFGGVMHHILAAKNEQEGFQAIHRCVMEHMYLTGKPTLEWLLDDAKKPRFSLDTLRVNLGLDKLDPTKQPGYVAPVASPGAAPRPLEIPVPATKASPASIQARVAADPAVLKDVKPEVIVRALDNVSREPMAERLISMCTLDECLKLQKVLNDRVAELAKEKAEEEPVAEPDKTEPEVTETATRRRRQSRRKTA